MATWGDASARGAARLLSFRVGAKVCVLPLEHVVETFRPLPVERLPDLPAFVPGLSIIRGQATPVVDVRTVLGSDDHRPPMRCISVSWETGKGRRDLALAVDAVLGLIELESERLGELPPLMRAGAGESVKALSTTDDRLLLLLEHTRLLPEPIWRALEAREATA